MNRIINVTTILGSLPLFVLVGLTQEFSEVWSYLGMLYISIIISFIAGIDWTVAILQKRCSIMIWSVILSLLPFSVACIGIYYSIALFWWWLSLLLILWISLLMDILIHQFLALKEPMTFRWWGTTSLSIAIIAALVRQSGIL